MDRCSAYGSQTYKKAHRAQVRGQYPSGPRSRPANPAGAASPPRTHNRSASARAPARTSTHLRTTVNLPSRSAAKVTRRRGVDSWAIASLCHHAEARTATSHTSDQARGCNRRSASLRRLRTHCGGVIWAPPASGLGATPRSAPNGRDATGSGAKGRPVSGGHGGLLGLTGRLRSRIYIGSVACETQDNLLSQRGLGQSHQGARL